MREKARSKPLKYSLFVPTKTMRRAAALHIVCNCVSRSHSQRFKMIPWLAKALFAVLDGLRGAVADAGHAVGAVLPPDGLSILQGDVVEGAAPDALAAAGAGISDSEGICLYKAGIEDGIHRPAHEAVVEVIAGGGEGLSGADGSMSAVEALLNAASVYMEPPDDIEALSEAVDKISRDAMESNDTSEAARKLYQQLLQDTGTDLAANYYDTGYKAYRSGDYETAIENLTKAVSYDETNSEALYALANSYRDNGNKRQAKETYQKVIELFPNTEKATQSQRALDQLDN